MAEYIEEKNRPATEVKQEIYNLFAELCAYIVRTQPKSYLVEYSCLSHWEQLRIEGKIKAYLPDLLIEKGASRMLHHADLTEGFLQKLQNFYELLTESGDRNCIMQLLQKLDGSLYHILRSEKKKIHTVQEIFPLNSNVESTGIELFALCKCVWARKSRQYFSERRIDIYLKHFLVVEKARTSDLKERHIFLPKGFFKNFDENGSLKVAASPLSLHPDFEIHYHRKQEFQSFTLTYQPAAAERMNELVWRKICQAGAEGAELVVFPEMLGSVAMEEWIQLKLAELAEAERDKIPSMIVLPTVFVGDQNYTSVLDRNGKLLARQYKQNPYVMVKKDGSYREAISGSDEVVIFHYPGIGRFAVMICKDFLTTRYMEQIMRSFKLTMIIVPAYSTGAYDFKTSFETCAHDYCNVVWINSCAAMVPGKEQNFRYIGYIRKRITRYQKETEAYHEMNPCRNLLTGPCRQDCLFYDSFGKV